MLRDYLKVEKEDQLVEQQSRHDNSQHYSSVTEWVILSKDGQRKGRVSLFDRFTTRRSWTRFGYPVRKFLLNGTAKPLVI